MKMKEKEEIPKHLDAAFTLMIDLPYVVSFFAAILSLILAIIFNNATLWRTVVAFIVSGVIFGILGGIRDAYIEEKYQTK